VFEVTAMLLSLPRNAVSVFEVDEETIDWYDMFKES
jgi:hypothetical protein